MLHVYCLSLTNMADVIRRVILLVLSKHCYDEYFINFNFFDGGCISLYVYVIVLGNRSSFIIITVLIHILIQILGLWPVTVTV
jgi:hypothetical protein